MATETDPALRDATLRVAPQGEVYGDCGDGHPWRPRRNEERATFNLLELGEVEMAETSKVLAKKRGRAGKGGARSSRRDGLIPAVIYGDKQPPMMIAVEPKSIEREMHREGFFNHRLQIDVDGQGFEVLPRDAQIDPVTDK